VLILSCEHGGNKIPRRYAHLFNHGLKVLNSHSGLDLGALSLARAIARRFDAPLIAATISRLLVDLNRSEQHRKLFSRFTHSLSNEEKAKIICHYYRPYRTQLHELIARNVAHNRTVLHLSVHSFTPVYQGVERATDIGLLYDPSRALELRCCKQLQCLIKKFIPDLRIHRNAPYRGVSDGFTCWLREKFTARQYAGIELEINQRYVQNAKLIPPIQHPLLQSLENWLIPILRT
jgi:predicted N-formylglutamate amidohydrolase